MYSAMENCEHEKMRDYASRYSILTYIFESYHFMYIIKQSVYNWQMLYLHLLIVQHGLRKRRRVKRTKN